MSYHNHHHYPHSHYDVAERLVRENRHSHRPTRYIVNDGNLILDEKTIRHGNTVIYNSRGSAMWLNPSGRHAAPPAPIVYQPYHSSWAYGVASPSCRGCYERRELHSSGYCRDCHSIRYYRSDRRLLGTPERRQLTWR